MDDVVPLSVKVGTGHSDGCHLFWAGLDGGLVLGLVALGLHFELSLSCRCGDKLHDNFMADEGFAPPVLSNVTEQAMLDFVPFARRRRKVANANLKTRLTTQLRQALFPQTTGRAIAAPAVGGNEQSLGIGIAL